MQSLLGQIRQCRVCEAYLPLGPRPVVQASSQSRILIIGQAPGSKVHKTGIPWNDPSGDELRRWLNIDRNIFYNPEMIAIVPMGFCYPGRGRSGDLPPRPECAPLWHAPLMALMPNLELILLIGQYAQNYYLKDKPKTLTETVRNRQDYLPKYFPLPHPSPRNRYWRIQNPWFEAEVIPELRQCVRACRINS
ncbi:MAG: uracil-DNA glycosylase family protein [Proteobacteria bacterium]|nr:MAG: uracil-DNA glycosylase family protein [Pseudomonadota bacterium]